MKSVCVLGLGYIGLPTSALLASRGHRVLGVDIRPAVIEKINRGEIHIFEPDLEDLVHAVVSEGRLKAALAPARADIFVIAVPTPFKGNHEPDLSYVEAAFDSIVPVLEAGNLVILESTSPVGTTRRLQDRLKTSRPDLAASVHFAYGPERVLPGKILLELATNDRIVGGLSPEAADIAGTFYETLTTGGVHRTTAETAELAKLTENAYRDVNIAFANELSMISHRLGINVHELISLTNKHPRVKVLQPGPGVGGHCIAVDPWFIVHAAPEEAQLIRKAREVNLNKAHFTEARILETLERRSAKSLAYLGLAYKADIDDVRESPALEILESLLQKTTADIYVVEPHLSALPVSLAGHPRIRLADLDTALAKCSVVALLVDHKEFRALAPARLAGKDVVDSRGVFSKPSLTPVSAIATEGSLSA